MSLRGCSWLGLFGASCLLVACGSRPDDPVPTAAAVASPSVGSEGRHTIQELGLLPVAHDPLGAPTLVRAVRRLAAIPGSSPEISARRHLARLAPAYGLVALPMLDRTGELTLRGGAKLVSFVQSIDGIRVEDGELEVLMASDHALLGVGGRIVGAAFRSRDSYSLSAVEALSRAIASEHGERLVPVARSLASGSEWVSLDVPAVGDLVVTGARARRVWTFHDDALAPAFELEAYLGALGSVDSELRRFLVHGATGEVLESISLTASDSFAYRVYANPDRQPIVGPIDDVLPHPTGAPDGFVPAAVAPVLVQVESLKSRPAGSVDPWLASGATQTIGNNVVAYSDRHAPDGFSAGDVYATTTSAGAFDRVYDLGLSPVTNDEQQRAAVTQLFYTVNHLHDYWYDSGFDEAHGNAQSDNLGRGGEGNDPLHAEAQDGYETGSRNNANMSTPADGMPPRMQMFVWEPHARATLTLDSGESLVTVVAAFGATSADLDAEIVRAIDAGGVSPSDGCEPLQNDVSGAIALIEAEGCTFVTKALSAQNAGAVGVIVFDTVDRWVPLPLPTSVNGGTVTIPVVSIARDSALVILANLSQRAVSATLDVDRPIPRDSALDATVVQHEWGHFLHYRLTSGYSPQSGAISEGWGDFVALHAQLRGGDPLDGAYPVGPYVTDTAHDPTYFGLRRAPYSRDPAKNALSFRHIANGAALPATHPLVVFGVNSEIHNAGEVWASMLFDALLALAHVHGVEEARRRMSEYVVAGMLLTPPDEIFTESRDGLLMAAAAGDPEDAHVIADAFSGRGLGTCAVAPVRESETFVGLVESHEAAPQVEVTSVALVVDDGCDSDGILDAGESGTVTVTLANSGPVAATTSVTLSANASRFAIAEPTKSVSVAPFAEASVSFAVGLSSGVLTVGVVEITASSQTPGACRTSPSRSIVARVHADERPNSATSTNFSASMLDVTIEGAMGTAIWSRTFDAQVGGSIHGIDHPEPSDTSIVTPTIEVGSGRFVVTFDHLHAFEFSSGDYWDGGVVEISVDGAAFVDVNAYAEPGYNGTIRAGLGAGNPLEGREVYGNRNPSYPSVDRVSLDFGTALAGRAIRLRFRIGTDQASGDEGWTIRSLSVSGATNAPFTAITTETIVCGGSGQLDGGANTTDAGSGEIDAGSGEMTPSGGSDGCGCTTGGRGGASPTALAAAAWLVLCALGRRRRGGIRPGRVP